MLRLHFDPLPPPPPSCALTLLQSLGATGRPRRRPRADGSQPMGPRHHGGACGALRDGENSREAAAHHAQSVDVSGEIVYMSGFAFIVHLGWAEVGCLSDGVFFGTVA